MRQRHVRPASIVFASVALLALASCAAAPSAKEDHTEAAVADTKALPPPEDRGVVMVASTSEAKAKLELFVMSKCPYARQFEGELREVRKMFGSSIDLELFYIGKTDDKGGFASLHGPSEVIGDLFQVCAQKYSDKSFDAILCQNEDIDNITTNWNACASRVGIDKATIAHVDECAAGNEGADLLSQSFAHSTQLGVRGSPTFFIDGAEFNGSRLPEAVALGICGHHDEATKSVCSSLPPPEEVGVTILTDARCESCDAGRLERSLALKIEAPHFKRLDYSDAEGRSLFDGIKPAKLPIAIFDMPLDRTPHARALFKDSVKSEGGHEVVSTGTWNPVCADTGGCKLGECKDAFFCRTEIPKKLDLFMMSHCPYAIKGIASLHQALLRFSKDRVNIDLDIHFIGDGTAADGFKSMHGPSEVEDDLREVCAMEHYKAQRKYFDFFVCRSADIKADWTSCTGSSTGFDADVIRKCAEGDEGKKLLEKSFRFSETNAVGASPTWWANSKFSFSGIDTAVLETNICKHNKLPVCDAIAKENAASAAAPPPSTKPAPPDAAKCGGPGSAAGACGGND